MKNLSAAARYARALMDVATAAKAGEAVVAQAAALHEAIHQPAITTTLSSGRLNRTQRTHLVKALTTSVSLAKPLANLLGVLAANNRLGLLADILHEVQVMADEAAGVARVQVQVADKLSAAQEQTLQAQVKQALKAKSVVLETTANPGLLGGFVALFGGKVWDASLASQFRRLKNQLSQATHQPR